jgi:hypothetical protein
MRTNKRTEKLIAALEFAAAGFAVIANDKTAARHSREFALQNFNQARDAINQWISDRLTQRVAS